MDGPASVYLFSSGWTSALFLLWGYYNAAVSVAIHFWFLIIAVFSGIYLGVRFLGQMVDSTFKLLRKCQLFSTLTRPFYVPTINICGLQFLQILVDVVIFL